MLVFRVCIYVPTKKMLVTKDGLDKLSQILKDSGNFINKLEKEENTEVFINETLDKVSLIHKRFGADVQKYIKVAIPIQEFSAKNEKNIIKDLRHAVEKTSNDWKRMDYMAQLH